MPDIHAFTFVRESDEPLCEQLRLHLARSIRSGALTAGSRLSATRKVADELSVNRATVVEAYRRLADEGLVEQRVGSGTYVLAGRRASDVEGGAARGRASSAVRELERLSRPSEPEAAPAGAIDLSRVVPDERDFPADGLASVLGRVMRSRGSSALGYGPPAGDPELREMLAARMTSRGLKVAASDVMVVGGAQQGLDVVFRALLDPGDLVATESPTYHLVLDLLRLHRAEVAGVPLVPARQAGLARLDGDRLEAVLARRPVLLYTVPTFHNPTGLSLDLSSRQRLAAACAAAGTVIVEDDYEADLRYEGERLPNIASLGSGAQTVYVGTLSKALFPGLRLGWVVAPPVLLQRLALVKRVSDLSGSVLLQAAAAELIGSGTYDRHVAEMVTENRERMRLLRESLEERLPRDCRVLAPRGGHALWVGLPEGVSGRAVADAARARGVLVAAGEAFLPAGGGADGLRLSIARVTRAEIAPAAERLAQAVAQAMQAERGAASARRRELESPVST
jgi:DNA-binding transcriptional MocR family regulator